MTKQDINSIKELLDTPKQIVIVTHINPDGDAIGSVLGLYQYLLKLNHNATVIVPNDYPTFLKWIPNQDNVKIYTFQKNNCNKLIKNADIIFTLDINDLYRTGEMSNDLEASKATKIMIDHHQQPNGYAAYMYSDPSKSSTSEMVYDFIEMLDDDHKIDANIATSLYVGIMTDTGSFRFLSTTSTTHRIIANLIDKGANNAQIHSNVYDNNSYGRLQLLGKALNNLKVISELNTAYISLSQQELNAYDHEKGDTEGVVNYALSLKGVKFAAIFIEDQQNNIVKISLRSKGSFSVNEFSRKHFEGGGHTNAAGGKSLLSLNETIEKFISILPHYKNALV